MPATHEDAVLLVQLAQWGTQLGLQDAMEHLFDEAFDPESADAPRDAAVRTVLAYGESLATLVKNNLLDRDLVHDWLWIEGMWGRVGPAALAIRDKAGEPRLYENFEALAQST